MRFGLHVPQLGALGEPAALTDLAQRAEDAGWDACFVWDHVMHRGDPPACDPWVALGAMAATTERILLGPMITPLPRRRPWKVAREVATLDRLARGRTVFGVGIGTDAYGEFSDFDEPAADDRTRAAMLDEALEVITALWTGERVHHAGTYFTVDDVIHTPTPIRRPRVPIWCAAVWPHRAPLRRAARWDGVIPVGTLTPADVAALCAEIARQRNPNGPFDVALPSSAATTPSIAEYGAAGVTWWLHSIAPGDDLATTQAVVDAGPPNS
jgi:alkanesulfonate monooxygenase SsuD/methylene tetrahydromethanopterin reductase-like flavin-dependent oxidoreductase (luciferase family)